MTKRPRRRSSPKKQQTPAQLAWFNYVNTGTMKNIALIAAAVGAVLYLNTTLFRPVYDSGPLPVPSRAEVEALRKEATSGLADVNMGLAETLEVAKAARVEAQQAVQQSVDARTTRLLQLKLELEGRIEKDPNDTILRELLGRTIADIAKLTAMPPSTTPTLQPTQEK